MMYIFLQKHKLLEKIVKHLKFVYLNLTVDY